MTEGEAGATRGDQTLSELAIALDLGGALLAGAILIGLVDWARNEVCLLGSEDAGSKAWSWPKLSFVCSFADGSARATGPGWFVILLVGIVGACGWDARRRWRRAIQRRSSTDR